MKNILALAACFAVLALAGCATPPDRIKPIKAAGTATCTAQDRQKLADLSKVQSATATNDAIGVFLVGVPVGSITGKDHEKEIATLKGKCE